MKYERSITSCLEVIAKVKVFVHATNADGSLRTMTLAPRTYLSQFAKNGSKDKSLWFTYERLCYQK